MKFAFIFFPVLFNLAVLAGDPYPAGAWNNVPDITDRAFWKSQQDRPGMREKIAQADRDIAGEVISPQPNYLDFSRDGNRSRYEAGYYKLHALGAPVMAACVTGEQRYIDHIEQRIRVLCALPTWILPAHDPQLDNYYGRVIDIDLGVATLGGELACTLRLLAPSMTPEVRNMLEGELERRIIAPLEEMMDGKRQENMWLTIKNNWNSVCLAGMTAVILRTELEPARRARLLDYIRKRSTNYLKGFGPDGYCGEGINYWSYGFGYYLRMAADFRQATDGKVNLMDAPGIAPVAQFAENIRLAPEVYPAFADANINFKLPLYTAALQNWLENKTSGFPAGFPLPAPLQDINLFLSLPESAKAPDVSRTEAASAFDNANVYVVRPAQSDSRLAAAFKGGNNTEPHNHNDIGSYIIAVDGVPVVVDPGREVYTKRTFSNRRYESNLLNSYGHSVPRIAGQLQAPGRGTDAVRKSIYQDRDSFAVELDITAPYRHIAEVQSVCRAFRYSRTNGGSFIVEDTVELKHPAECENAVITLGQIEKIDAHTYRITEKQKSLFLNIDCGGIPFTTAIEPIREDTHHKREIFRLSIKPDGKIKNLKMTLTFTPSPTPVQP